MRKTLFAAIAAFVLTVSSTGCVKSTQTQVTPGNAKIVTSASFTVNNWTYDPATNT